MRARGKKGQRRVEIFGLAAILLMPSWIFASTSPDLFLQVSQTLGNKLVAQKWTDQRPISEFALGACISGESNTEATTQLVFVPNLNEAEFAIDAVGKTEASTSASQSRATVYSESVTTFHSRKYAWLEGETGIREVPSQTNTQVSSVITGVDVDAHFPFRWLVERIATRRAYEMKPEADNLTASEVAQAVNQKIDSAFDAEITQAEDGIKSLLQGSSLADWGYHAWRSRSETQWIALEGFLDAKGVQFLPVPFSSPPDLGIAATESGLTTPLERLLAGVTIDLNQWLEPGPVPPDFHKQNFEPIFTFANQDPIEIHFQNNAITAQFQLSDFSQSGTHYPARKIIVSYLVSIQKKNLRLKREGDILILPPNANSEVGMSEQDKQIEKELQNALDPILAAGIAIPPLHPAGVLEKLGALQFTTVSAQNGQLVAGLTLVPAALP